MLPVSLVKLPEIHLTSKQLIQFLYYTIKNHIFNLVVEVHVQVHVSVGPVCNIMQL